MQEVGNVQSGDCARVQSAASREKSDNGQLRHGTGVAHAKVTSSPDITRARKPEFQAEDVPADFRSRKLKDALSPSLADWLSEPGKVDSSTPKMPIISEGKPEKGESREGVATQAVDRMASEITSDRPTSLHAQANVAQVAALHLLSVETPAEASQEPDQRQYRLSDAPHDQNTSDVDPERARKTGFAEDAPLTSFVDWFSEHSKTGSNAPEMSIVSEGKSEKDMSGEIVAAQTVGRMASEIASNRPKSLLLQANVTQGEALHLLTMGEMAEAAQGPDEKQHTSFDASHGQDAPNVGPVSAGKPEFPEEDIPADSSSEKLKDALLVSFLDWSSGHSKTGSDMPEISASSEGKPESGASWEIVAAQVVGRVASEIASNRPMSQKAQANVTQDAALHLLSMGALAETIQEPGQKPHTLFDADYMDVRTKVAKMPNEPV